jgi:hypothetical protein
MQADIRAIADGLKIELPTYPAGRSPDPLHRQTVIDEWIATCISQIRKHLNVE